MDDFIVFRCNPENRRKLIYLMLGLNCTIGIIDALFFLVFGSTFQKEWPGFIKAIQFLLEAKLTQICQKPPEHREYPPFQHRCWQLHSLYWNPHGPTIVGEMSRCITFVRGALMGAINIDKSNDGSLSIETVTGFHRKKFTTDAFRFSQFDATLDAHLALLFKD